MSEPKFHRGQTVVVSEISPGYEDEHPRTGATVHVPPMLKCFEAVVKEFDAECNEYLCEKTKTEHLCWYRADSVFETKAEAEEAFEEGKG